MGAKRWRWGLVVVLALTSACSALIDPDENRLRGAIDAGGTSDGPGDIVALDLTDTAMPGEGIAPADLPSGDGVVVDAPPPDAPPPDAPPPDAPPPDAPPPDVRVDVVDVPSTRCPMGCDDRVACTVDACDEAAGRCAFRPDSTRCPEGQVCEPSMGGCVRIDCRTDEACQNGDLCDGRERCVGGRCVPGPRVECNDGIACTMDACVPATGTCTFTPSNAACDDRVACTVDACSLAARGCTHLPMPTLCPVRGPCVAPTCGASGCTYAPVPGFCDSFCFAGGRCDLATGTCIGGSMPRDCGDSNPCTNDRCDPAARMCRHDLRDDDGDGFPAQRAGTVVCAGGTDCNDMNPAVHPRAMEVCNGQDDNCNNQIDEGGVCPVVPGDTCASAIPLDLSTRTTEMVSGRTSGFANDYRSACGGMTGPDVVYAVTVPNAADVAFEVQGMGTDPVLAVRESCGSFDFVCNDDASRAARATSRVWVRPRGSSGTRTYFVTVDANDGGGSYVFRALVRNPGLAPATCGSAAFDVTLGGTMYGNYPFGLSNHTGSCGGGGGNEDVLIFNATAPQRVELTLFAPSAVLYARQGMCTGFGVRDITCQAAARMVTINPMFNPGRGFIVVDGGPFAGGGHYVLVVHP